MKRFDEDDVAKRLGAAAPPPPPDLAARIKQEIPERVEVAPALTRPAAGTLPFLRTPLGRRLLALAAILVVGIAANLVVRRMTRPGPAPLEVALIESAPAPEQGVAEPAAETVLFAAPPPPPPAPAAAKAAVAPQAKAAASPARDEGEKGHRRAEAVAPGEVPAPQAAAPTPARFAAAEAKAAEGELTGGHGLEGGELGGVVGGVPGGVPASAPASLEESAMVYRVGGPVTAPEPVRLVEPDYPEAARRDDLRGEVVIEAVIDRRGMVAKPRVVGNTTGSEECAGAALRAVRRWRYRPALLEGRPVDVSLTLTVVFGPRAVATATPTP